MASYMPERTDKDIKNYWNTHLKKKFIKTGAGAEAKSGRWAAPKGQWERRLQTDIHTARQALREALSLDRVPPSAKTEQLPQPPAPASQAQATYASSAENIARLLECWTHRGGSGTAGKLSSESRSSSVSAFFNDEGVSASNSGTGRTPEGNTRTSKAEDAARGRGHRSQCWRAGCSTTAWGMATRGSSACRWATRASSFRPDRRGQIRRNKIEVTRLEVQERSHESNPC